MNARVLVSRILVFSLVLLALAGARWSLYRARLLRSSMPSSFDSYYLPSATALHYAALGHDAFAADLVWTRSLVYFGHNFFNRGLQTWLKRYLDTVTDLDPHFRDAYLWAGTSMIYGGQAIDEESIGNAIHFYEKGLRVFPNDWELAWNMGFELYLDLAPRLRDEKKRQEVRKRALRYFVQVGKSPDAPPFFRSFVLGTLDREGLRQVARSMAAQVYALTRDEKDVRFVEKHLNSILGRTTAAQWERWRREPVESWKKEYPFVPFELYLLMRNGARTDLRSLLHGTNDATPQEGMEVMQ